MSRKSSERFQERNYYEAYSRTPKECCCAEWKQDDWPPRNPFLEGEQSQRGAIVLKPSQIENCIAYSFSLFMGSKIGGVFLSLQWCRLWHMCRCPPVNEAAMASMRGGHLQTFASPLHTLKNGFRTAEAHSKLLGAVDHFWTVGYCSMFFDRGTRVLQQPSMHPVQPCLVNP